MSFRLKRHATRRADWPFEHFDLQQRFKIAACDGQMCNRNAGDIDATCSLLKARISHFPLKLTT